MFIKNEENFERDEFFVSLLRELYDWEILK